MKITFLLPFAGIAGGIRVVSVYADRLRRRGHEIHVVSLPHWFQNRRSMLRDFITRRLSMKVRGQEEPSFLRGLDIQHTVLDRYRPITDADVPDGDVVIATWWETAEWAAALSPRKGAKVYFLQGYDAASGQPEDRVNDTWRLPLKKIVVSRWLADLARNTFHDDTVSIVSNSVDTDQFNAPPRSKQQTPTVGTMYSVKPYRGCGHVFEAVERAALKYPELNLCSFGIGPEDKVALPVPDRCTYHEMPPQDELSSLYSCCDAWLSCPEVEGFGLPILEAFACRTPVIATRAGAAEELLATGGGTLVNYGNVEQITDAIVQMLEADEQRWKQMSDRAYEKARSYSWGDATDLFEEALEDAVVSKSTVSLATN